jgi:hypothetical protein
MREPYLEVTFRTAGRWRRTTTFLARSTRRACGPAAWSPGLVIDYASDGSAIGIEITTPTRLSLPTLNAVLAELGHAPAREADLAPLAAA